MAPDGGFPAELKRTKPYGYSLFVLDAMAGVAQLASTTEDNLWTFALPDGRGMRLGLEFLVPFVEDKGRWPHTPDVMFWDQWPVRHFSVLLGGLHFENPRYVAAWEHFEADPAEYEVRRNLPLRHPLLWVGTH